MKKMISFALVTFCLSAFANASSEFCVRPDDVKAVEELKLNYANVQSLITQLMEDSNLRQVEEQQIAGSTTPADEANRKALKAIQEESRVYSLLQEELNSLHISYREAFLAYTVPCK